MHTGLFSELQMEAFTLAREIIAFVKANPYRVDRKTVQKYERQYGEAAGLVYRDPAGRILASIESPRVGVFIDNAAHFESLRKNYTEQFAERVEAIRLKLVAAKVVFDLEKWYTQFYMTEIRMRQVAAYLVVAAFLLDGIELAPNVKAGSWGLTSGAIPL